MNSLLTGSVYALAAVGLALLYSLMGVLNLAHGHLMMIGGYLFFSFSVFGLPPELGISLTLVCMAPIGLMLGRVFIEPFALSGSLLPLVTTIACATILESAVSLIFGINVVSAKLLSDPIVLSGVILTRTQVWILIAALFLLLSTAMLMKYSPIGRLFRAVSEKPIAASSLGIHTRILERTVIAVSALFAGVAGIMMAAETNLYPSAGAPFAMKAAAATLLGGLGSIPGAIVGSFLLAFVENCALGVEVFGVSIPLSYKDTFSALVVLTVLLLRPQGIFGRHLRHT